MKHIMESDFFPKASRNLKMKFISPNLLTLSPSYSYSSYLKNKDSSISPL